MTEEAQLLGPAQVLAVSPAGVTARLEDGREVQVELALPFPWRPAPGDELLVLSGVARHHAIGVVSGQACPTLSFPGDAELRAEGVLHLRGGEALELEAPQVTVRAGLMRTFAGTLLERADEAYRWVQEVLTVRAGESRRLVQGEDFSQSERSVTLARGAVKLDGKQLQLGH